MLSAGMATRTLQESVGPWLVVKSPRADWQELFEKASEVTSQPAHSRRPQFKKDFTTRSQAMTARRPQFCLRSPR